MAKRENAKHTPGPWEISETLHIDGNGEYRRIQQPYFGGDIVGLVCVAHKANTDLNKCGPSNARLIAAAPDLACQLLAAANYIDALGGDSKSYRAAISKATGDTP